MPLQRDHLLLVVVVVVDDDDDAVRFVLMKMLALKGWILFGPLVQYYDCW